jgi:hypothetical protein
LGLIERAIAIDSPVLALGLRDLVEGQVGRALLSHLNDHIPVFGSHSVRNLLVSKIMLGRSDCFNNLARYLSESK